MSAASETTRILASLSEGLSDTTEGSCVNLDWTNRLAVINVSGGTQPMPWLGSPPLPGDRVRVIYAGNKPMCELIQGSPVGTVVSVASSIATVAGDDGRTYQYAITNGATYVAGNRVRLDHPGRLIAARYAVDPPGLAVPVLPPVPGSSNNATFAPTDSGNYRSGVFDSQYAEISSTRTAAYWYGTQIADSIPDSAVITRAEINLVELWDQVPGTATQMGTHTQASRGAEPTISGSINVLGTGTPDISSFANALKTGAALGIGFRKNTGWRRFDTFAGSGSIYMEWQ